MGSDSSLSPEPHTVSGKVNVEMKPLRGLSALTCWVLVSFLLGIIQGVKGSTMPSHLQLACDVTPGG